jgi:hypothetical protein
MEKYHLSATAKGYSFVSFSIFFTVGKVGDFRNLIVSASQSSDYSEEGVRKYCRQKPPNKKSNKKAYFVALTFVISTHNSMKQHKRGDVESFVHAYCLWPHKEITLCR